ncbi:MAG: hypothetical protein E7258_02265 [Lachnospiraceae bacterium]|nr:hypothetical protein [Lachnospiraceae bacterium]
MSKKKVLIIVSVLIVLLVVGAFFFIPRIRLYNAIKDLDLGPRGEMFAQYDVTDDTLVKTEAEYFYIGVPEGYVYEDNDSLEIYRKSDTECVAITKETNEGTFSLLDEMYEENFELFGIDVQMEDIKKGFEYFEYGKPDNEYNTIKHLYLLNEDDYSFWNYKKGLAYAYSAYIKSELIWMSKQYIYERENMCATIMVGISDDNSIYTYFVTIYDPEDLNTSNIVMIKTEDEQQAHDIINSIELK